jgi:hypothetical protein
VSGAILSNVLSSELRSKLDPGLIAQLTSSVFNLKKLNLSDGEVQLISQSYMDGIHAVFLSYTALTAIHLYACLFIEDYGLAANRTSHAERRSAETGNNNE